MKHNKWKDELYELSGGSDDYGDCTVYVKEAIPFISSLLKEQREEDRKKYLTREGNAEMSRDARARLGLTQVEMAKRLGISTIQLIKVEGGDRGFSKKVLIKLSILKGKKK